MTLNAVGGVPTAMDPKKLESRLWSVSLREPRGQSGTMSPFVGKEDIWTRTGSLRSRASAARTLRDTCSPTPPSAPSATQETPLHCVQNEACARAVSSDVLERLDLGLLGLVHKRGRVVR